MTVRDLFEHFNNYFAKISYRKWHSYDTVHLENEDCDKLTNDFLQTYGDCIVNEWSYERSDNLIRLMIS